MQLRHSCICFCLFLYLFNRCDVACPDTKSCVLSSLGLTLKYFLELFARSHVLPTVCLFFFFPRMGLYPQAVKLLLDSLLASSEATLQNVQMKVFPSAALIVSKNL